MSANIKASTDGTQAIIGVGGVDQMTVNNAGVVTANSFVGTVSNATALATGSTTARTLANRFADVVNVKDFGAHSITEPGYGTFDSTTAIQNAINAANGGTVFFPKGTYLTSATLLCDKIGASIIGDSAGVATISATHTTGAVIKFTRRFSNIKNIAITSSGSRAAATNATGFGVQFECEDVPDSTTIRMQACVCENVSVQNQPGTAFYWVGPANQGSVMQSCYANANRGHGFVQDRGQLSGRTNLAITSGCMTIDTCLFYFNLGNGLAVGNPSETQGNAAVRIIVDNCEFSQNASDAAIRFSNTQIYLDGTNHEVRSCVMHPPTGSNGGGIYCIGRNQWFINNRYLECVYAVNVGYNAKLQTQGINVEGITCINSVIPNMNPAVVVDAGAINTRVLNWVNTDITSLITPNVPGTQIESIEQYIKKTTDQVVTNSTTLVDDTDLKFPVYEFNSYYFVANIDFTSGTTSEIKLAFTVPSGAVLRWGPINGLKVDPSGSIVVQGQETTSGNAISFGYSSAGSRQLITVTGYVECNAGENGNLQLQWAQNTASSAEPTTVRNGSSYLKVFTYKN